MESPKAKVTSQTKKQLVTADTTKVETKPVSRQVIQKTKQAMQMPKVAEMPKQAVRIEPIEVKEAASTITPRTKRSKTQILGFFDTDGDDLY